MKQKTGRKLLAFLLTLAMVFGQMSGMSLTVRAVGEKAYAAYDVTTETNKTKSGDDLTALQVTFNERQWYIIEDNSSSATSGTVTLLSADTSFGTKTFDNEYTSNKYSTSQVKAYLDSMTGTGGAFEDVADAIETVNLTTNKYFGNDVYETVNNVKLYLLSTEEANSLPTNVRKAEFTGGDCYNNEWWLCSPGNEGSRAAFVVGDNGGVRGDGAYVYGAFGVRPALKLNLESVIFSSETNTFTVGSATVDVTDVSLDKTTATVTVDDKVALTATVSPDNATDKKVTWSVGGTDTGAVKLYTDEACTTEVGADATDTLTVYAKGISAGDVTVTATGNADETKSAVCLVTVYAAGEKAYTAYDVTIKTNKTKSGNALTALQVTFNERQWYIIEDNSSSATSGTVTLLSADTTFGTNKFADNESNKYSTSQVKAYLDSLTGTGGAFEDVADAIETVNLTTNKFESTEEYETVNGVKLYLLSTEEADSLPVRVLMAGFTGEDCYNNEWWLRSPGNGDSYAAFVWGEGGDVDAVGYNVRAVVGVRPALKLNLPSVIFSSVNLSGGANAAISGGTATQNYFDMGNTRGAMTTVTYTAKANYKFPETSELYKATNGITVTRTSDTVITVSGTPTATDTSVAVPDAVQSSIAVTGISLDKTTATVTVDDKVALTATVEPDNATDKKVKWSTSGSGVKLYTDEACTTEVGSDATETLTVYAKGISAGDVTVTATGNADETKSAVCVVTVNAAAAPAPEYRIIKGGDATWTKGTDGSISIEIVSSEEPDGSFARYKCTKDGDNELTAVVTQGSTIVTLAPEVLEKMTEGKHTITVEFTNGSVSTTLTILPKQTYDDTPAADTSEDPIAAILLVTIFAAGAMVLIKRRKRA